MLLKMFQHTARRVLRTAANPQLFIEKDCQASETFNEHTLNEMLRNN
jgi:hypothetical protein